MIFFDALLGTLGVLVGMFIFIVIMACIVSSIEGEDDDGD